MRQHSINKFTIILTMLLATLFGFHSNAQNYPVQTSIATTGPYLNYLSYYGDQNNHLQITITNLSFNSPALAVRLRLRIEGSGWELFTNPNATIGQPFIIEPGMPVTISGIELLPYLQANNLINPDGVDLNNLPHGFTNICVDVINESAQQQVLSTNNCGFLPIQEYQPPQAFVPTCGDQLDTSSMFHIFSWTPPVPFPAGADIELFYDFSIRHWIDPLNNSALGGNSILVYEELDLIAPTTQVSDFDVQWDMGGTYIWTVTARVESNGIPLTLIENNGVSAPCTFVYGEEMSLADQLADGLEIELFTSPSSARKGKAWWTVTDYTPNQGLSNFDEFFVEFRRQPTGNEGYQVPWFYKTVTSFEHFIHQLEPSTMYEVKVSGIIAGVVGDPTPVKTFTTNDPRVYNCGESDLPYLPTNYTVLENATAGTQVQIGQFMMTMTEVDEIGGGHYAGKGTIPIPFLGGAKAKVCFDDILIDTEYLVHEGRVDVVTKGLENWLNEQYSAFIDPYYVDGVIDSAWVDSTAGVAWVMVDGNPQSFPFDPPNLPVIVNDENGNQYTIYPNGLIVVGTYLAISETWAVMPDEVIHFSQNDNETLGFDGKEHMEWHENYEIMMLQDSSKYFVANKSLAKGEGDFVNVEVPAGASASFEFSDGTDVTDTDLQGNWIGTNLHTGSTQRTLNIPARNSSGSYSIYAWVNNEKVGQLNVRVYSPKDKDVVIVPIASSSLDKAQTELYLDQTFGEANIDVNVEVASQWNSSTFTDTSFIDFPSDVGLLNKYSDEMSAVRDAYFFENDLARTDAYYLFLIADFDDPSKLGYMPRGKSYGFISVNQSDVLNTISHELGHGIGTLEHTWKDNGPQSLTTGNMMDYANSSHPENENLTQAQWKELREFNFLPNIWDDESDASSAIAIMSEVTGSDEIANYVSEEKLIDKSVFPESPVIAMALNQYFKFSDEAWAKIKSLKFTNGILSGLDLHGANGEVHDAILERTSVHLLPKSGPNTLRMVTVKSEDGYHFQCTNLSHQNERGVENVVDHGQVSQVVSEGCGHDFSFGDALISIACEDIIGNALAGYDNNVFTMEYPICPDPSSSEFFFIPRSWRNKKDNSFCFMTPDGKVLKTSAGGFRAVKYGVGLSALPDHEMLPSGCVIEFAHQANIDADVVTYRANVQNGVFQGYKNVNGANYYSSFKAAHAQDTGIMLLPAFEGLEVYYFDASQYTYADSNSQGGAVLDISTDYNSILGWGITAFSSMDYSDSDMATLSIDSEIASDFLMQPISDRNKEHRLIVKAIELASAYPGLATRMSKCDYKVWTGLGCSNILSVLTTAPMLNNPVVAALTDNGTWGYFDYMYDDNDYDQLPIEEQLRLYIVHFKELIIANRLANLTVIESILDTAGCSVSYNSTNSPSVQIEPEAIFNALSAMSIDEIRNICLPTRINLIASLSFRPFAVTNDYEKSIYRLIKYVAPIDAYDLVEELSTKEYNNVVLIKQIATKVDDQVMFFGDDNYFSEIAKTLIRHYSIEPNILTNMNFSQLTNQQFEELSKRLVTFNYTGVVKRLFTSCGVPALAGNGATISSVTLEKVSSEWEIAFEDNLEICFSNVRASNQRTFGLLEPLIITDDARLMALSNTNGTAMVMPAFILYFLEEKAWAKSAVEAIETTVDVLSMCIPGAQGTMFFRVLNYADKASSFTNMAANYTQIDNPTLSSFLSITSGVLGLADFTGNTVANFRKVKGGTATEQEIFELITRNESRLSENHTKAINDLLEVVDDNTDADLIKILGSDEAKGHFIELLEAEDAYLTRLGQNHLANQVKARVNTLKAGNTFDVVNTSLIQMVNGAFPINAADFAGLNFSFDLVGNVRMRSIVTERWKNFTPAKKALLEQDFAALHVQYPNGIDFSPEGFPIFTPHSYIHNGQPVNVDIGALHPNVGKTKGSGRDMSVANEMMKEIDPSWTKPDGYTWHHIENSTQLQLIPTLLHKTVKHSGGRATYNFSAWLNDVETILGATARSNIESWISEGVNSTKMASAFVLSNNKSQLFNSLENALSHYHRVQIVKDYKNLPGIKKSNFSPNGLSSNKSHAPWNNPALNLPSFDSGNFMDAIAIELPAGTKIYRVTGDSPLGGYWMLKEPTSIDEVMGDYAVRASWNSFENLYLYEVPQGQILRVWKGKASRQRVDAGVDFPHLPGGEQQLFIPQIERDNMLLNSLQQLTVSW